MSHDGFEQFEMLRPTPEGEEPVNPPAEVLELASPAEEEAFVRAQELMSTPDETVEPPDSPAAQPETLFGAGSTGSGEVAMSISLSTRNERLFEAAELLTVMSKAEGLRKIQAGDDLDAQEEIHERLGDRLPDINEALERASTIQKPADPAKPRPLESPRDAKLRRLFEEASGYKTNADPKAEKTQEEIIGNTAFKAFRTKYEGPTHRVKTRSGVEYRGDKARKQLQSSIRKMMRAQINFQVKTADMTESEIDTYRRRSIKQRYQRDQRRSRRV